MKLGNLGIAALILMLAGCGLSGGDPSATVEPQLGAQAPAGPPTVVDEIVVPTEDGATVPGLLGYVRGSRPTRLVVFCHGFGHSVQSSWREHVARTVRRDTAVVAVSYRGVNPGSPKENAPFPVMRGAQDTIAATRFAKERFATIDTVYLLGVSMGAGVAGTAIVESAETSPDGASLYHYWIDVEGVSMLAETWAEARAAAPAVAAAIEDDAGGSPDAVPQAYVDRSPALRAGEMQAAGLRAAVVVHATPNDGVVPFNQSREMATALAAAGVPTHFFQVLRDADDEATPNDNTGSGVIFEGVLGEDDPNSTLGLYLTGHGTESQYDHPVIRTGFEQLEKMLDGTYVVEPYRETFVDEQLT